MYSKQVKMKIIKLGNICDDNVISDLWFMEIN